MMPSATDARASTTRYATKFELSPVFGSVVVSSVVAVSVVSVEVCVPVVVVVGVVVVAVDVVGVLVVGVDGVVVVVGVDGVVPGVGGVTVPVPLMRTFGSPGCILVCVPFTTT